MKRFPIVTFALATGTIAWASTDAYAARCAVFRGDRLIERASCIATKDRRSGKPNAMIYRWRTGGTTRTSNEEESFTINGGEGVTEGARRGYDLCVLNYRTRNTFCVRF